MPSQTLRQSVLANARRIVVKIGTQALTARDPAGQRTVIDVPYLHAMARQIATLRQRGIEVTLVSSGAIGAGCAELNLAKRPHDVAELQAIAAVGQRRLMTHMHDAFEPLGLQVGQVLLTRGDFDDRTRFLNIRNCISHLHTLGCVPIINENDTVAVEELRFGDNDLLAALICNALRADALILLTVVDGLLDADGQRIDLVPDIGEALRHARKETSPLGSGGIQTKLESARLVTESGEIAVIANGRAENVLLRLFDGEKLGTVFVPKSRKLGSRERWIGLTKRPTGTLIVDDGAVRAVCGRGKSLLAGGIVAVEGRFQRGHVVSVRSGEGAEIARGLSNYAADEARQIMGAHSEDYEKILGRPAYPEVIHRNNMVIVGRESRASAPA